MTRALVLSGGGSKGAYELGVLRHLLVDLGTQYDILCGTSVGALNAGLLAMYPAGSEVQAYEGLKALWDGMHTSSVYTRWPKFGLLAALWKPSVYDSTPLQKLTRAKLDQSRVVASGKKLRVGAVGLATGEYRVFEETYPDIAGAVLASSAFPGMLTPIFLEGQLWTDGGVKNITPVQTACELGADHIDVVVCGPPRDAVKFPPTRPTALHIGKRVIDIMSDQVSAFDLGYVQSSQPNKTFRLVQPTGNPIEDPLDFAPAKIQAMQRMGYEDACATLDGASAHS